MQTYLGIYHITGGDEMKDLYLVPVEKLKNRCKCEIFDGKTTEDLPASSELIGQERAMEALKYGLSINRKGYNIYVSGLTGTGKNSYSFLVAMEFASKKKPPKDWCYVYNFKKPDSPKAISMSNGQGKIFKRDVEKVIENLKMEIPKALTSKEYESRRQLIYSSHQSKAQEVLEELNELAKEYNFIFKQTDKGILNIPMKDGRPMTDEELDNLSEEEMKKLIKDSNELNQKSYEYIKRVRELEKNMIKEIEKLREDKVREVLDIYVDVLIDKYNDNQGICEYLNDLKSDIISNYELFLVGDEKKPFSKLNLMGSSTDDIMKRYEVNLFMNNSDKTCAPVVREMNPTYYNLFGKIEYVNEMGGFKTDHTKIRPGALHEANGGYIILQAKDVLINPHAWEGLKRALITEKIKVENITGLNVISETLTPEPIPLDVKVILIGDLYTYQLLYHFDDDFKKLFKIRADFDVEMDRNEENIRKIGSFVAYQCKDQNLKPFDKSALAAIIEYSSRLAAHQNKLTARFNELVEIIYEADQWASINNKPVVTEKEVKLAIEKKNFRNNIYEEKIIEAIKNGTIIIDTKGEKIGEINGLSVINVGQYVFGRPSKITVNTFAGKEGIINIEREVNQSGSIHDKGVLILGGYLGEKYAKDFPLTLTASITFEQSYSEIDGDSASSTELYALLSSLAEKPIKQSIAVTGSVNQKGLIQPIGGVNEKIEGFFKICKLKGLTGEEGVIIPYQNIENLMLDDEVIEAVEKGLFKIYAVKTIDEGIEILTGVKAGKLDENGEYEKGSINYLVQEKLRYYSELSKNYG